MKNYKVNNENENPIADIGYKANGFFIFHY